jgi:glycosyltransferase involved in cell wall biosynthesis
VILTYNEALHLARCLTSIIGIASRVVVVDSFSSDDTVTIAKAYGAEVLQNRFVNQAVQFQWALDTANITTDWVMRLDADEIVEPELVTEIQQRLDQLPLDVVGINLNRKHIFLERWIRHGGRFPLTMLRIWRNGKGRIEQRWMDEHIFVEGGRTVTFKGRFADHNLNDLTFFTDKHNKYATREAVEVLNKKYGLFENEKTLSRSNASLQASIKRHIKEKIYNKMPFWLGPTGYFLYRYIVLLGFLDGQSGLIYHFLQGFWYRFLVGAKVAEFEHHLANISDPDARLDRLRALTGLDL